MMAFNMGAVGRGEYQTEQQAPVDTQDYQSKAAFENFLREQGDTAYVDQYVQEHPDQFLTPAQLYKLEQVGPEEFWGGSTNPVNNVGNTAVTPITLKTPEQLAAEAAAAEKTAKRKSAYDLLYQEFNSLGLGSLVEPLKALIADAGVSPSEFAIKLQETDAYKKRFSANAQRIAAGLRALSPAEYIGLEDQYQNIMRNYGMPESYYTKGELGKQSGFDKLIAGDVSAVELEDRLQTAYDRVIKTNPEISQALRNFYPEISDGDILAYALDPKNALTEIKRKVSAAEIGGAALSAGLLGRTPEEIAKNLPGFGQRAKELVGFGITGQQYGAQSPFITSAAERGGQLASIYGQDTYGRTQAESEAFNITGATEARKQRQKLTQLEQASFSGSSGTSNAIARDRAGAF